MKKKQRKTESERRLERERYDKTTRLLQERIERGMAQLQRRERS